VNAFEITNPATEEVVATVPRGGVENADRAVAAAARAQLVSDCVS
jgi:acyl-CoA reductase-like NAD-dependent aldehyde dehydrogenase